MQQQIRYGQGATIRKSSARRWLRELVERKSLSPIMCGIVALVVAALFNAVETPVPKIHDEFSYLLAADTFREGRLTNPPHPFWKHFETLHVIQQPTYASKYQPGQGLFLALGGYLGGHPIVGAWLTTALAAAAVCWMLQAKVPNRWALCGGLLVALHAMIHARWSLSFWGGSLPMAGGALLFGGFFRAVDKPRIGSSIAMASGAVILAATRPFEGAVVAACAGGALLVHLICSSRHRGRLWSHLILPAALMSFLGLAFLGYYNYRVTGEPLTLPYQVHEADYGYSPLFLWKPLPPEPEYRHKEIRDFQTGWGIKDYLEQQSLSGWCRSKASGLFRLGKFFLGTSLLIPLIALPQLLKARKLRFVWFTLAIFLLAEATVPWTFPHYFAPVAPLIFLLAVEALRLLHTSSFPKYRLARLAVPAVFTLHLLTLAGVFGQYVSWERNDWQWKRAAIVEQLQNTGENHLVFVRYEDDREDNEEWVYNGADIDQATIVWAREMDAEENQRLMDYFSDRKVWLLYAEEANPQLLPYPASSQETEEYYSLRISSD